MQKKELIEKKIDANDKRKTIISITEAGKEIITQRKKQAIQFIENVIKELDEKKVLFELNRKTSSYIQVLSCEKVSDDFHARFSVKEKMYVYKINIGDQTPFKADYYLYYKKDLSLKKLKAVAKVFKGVHDFRNFVSGERDNYECIIYDIKIKKERIKII